MKAYKKVPTIQKTTKKSLSEQIWMCAIKDFVKRLNKYR